VIVIPFQGHSGLVHIKYNTMILSETTTVIHYLCGGRDPADQIPYARLIAS